MNECKCENKNTNYHLLNCCVPDSPIDEVLENIKAVGRKVKPIFGIVHKETGHLLFSYMTNQGNTKKAFFSSEANALKAFKRYIKCRTITDDNFEVFEIGTQWKDNK